jgi:hypothetical protein
MGAMHPKKLRSMTNQWLADRAKRVLLALILGGLLSMPVARAAAAELFMFEAPGCPWCRMWHSQVGPGYGKSDEGRRAPLRRLAMHGPLPEGISLSAPILVSPTFVLVSEGREVGRIIGYPGADFFWGLLAELVKKLDGPATKASKVMEGRMMGSNREFARAAQVDLRLDDTAEMGASRTQ